MSTCCRGGPCEPMFTRRFARRSLARYRKKGLDGLERRMVASTLAGELHGARVLEIGGGIGAVQSELLSAGAASGEVVELVPAYEPYARELAREKGFEDRTSFLVADLLDDPTATSPADIVVLNRVVCCSPDGVELVSTASRLARRSLLVSYPRAAAWTRFGIRVLNLGQWLLRRSFRVFLHPPAALRAAAESEGMQLADTGRSLVWEFAVLSRAA